MKSEKTKLSFQSFTAKAKIEKNTLAKITGGTLSGCNSNGHNGGGRGSADGPF